ncbi:hypothetical protein DL93DRAFT_2230062 [Clavulina sp. PMI_390]|nr:hypothetical protein DL93DRAFT_2230062 [Clavulina sp. PMI_390]
MSDIISLPPRYTIEDISGPPEDSSDNANTHLSRDVGPLAPSRPTTVRAPYLYYQLFKNGRALMSHQSYDSEYNALGRVRRISIAPPRTIASFCLCVLELEGFGMSDVKEVYFEDYDVPVSLHALLPVGVGDTGTTPEEPIALMLCETARRKIGESLPVLEQPPLVPEDIPLELDPADPTRVVHHIAVYPGPGWRRSRSIDTAYLLDWNGGKNVQNVTGANLISRGDGIWVRSGVSRDLTYSASPPTYAALDPNEWADSLDDLTQAPSQASTARLIHLSSLTRHVDDSEQAQYGEFGGGRPEV